MGPSLDRQQGARARMWAPCHTCACVDCGHAGPWTATFPEIYATAMVHAADLAQFRARAVPAFMPDAPQPLARGTRAPSAQRSTHSAIYKIFILRKPISTAYCLAFHLIRDVEPSSAYLQGSQSLSHRV